MRNPHPNVLRVLLGLLIVAGLAYWVAGVRDIWEMEVHADRHVAAPLEFDDDTGVAKTVQPEARAAGIVPGVTITGLNGAPYTGLAQFHEILWTSHPGDTLDVEYLRRNGTQSSGAIRLAPHAALHPGISRWVVAARDAVVFVLMPLACLLIGYWVALVKPADKNAWLLLILLTFPSVLFISAEESAGMGIAFRLYWYETLQMLASPALLLFGVYFPERSRIDRKIPWLKWLVLAPYPVVFGLLYPYLHQLYFAAPPAPRLQLAIVDAAKALNGLNLACIVLYLILTVDKLWSASTADARRRLRVLTVGTGVGVGSLLLVFVLLPHFGLKFTTLIGNILNRFLNVS